MCKYPQGPVPRTPNHKQTKMKTHAQGEKSTPVAKNPYHSSSHSRRMGSHTAGQDNRSATSFAQKSRKTHQGLTYSQKLAKMDFHNNNTTSRDENANGKRPRRISEGSPIKQLQQINGNSTTASRESNIRTSPGPSTRAESKSPTQGNAYAGPKFSDPPSPKVLPKPPVHWFSERVHANKEPQNCAEMTNVLKVMLKVQA